MTKLKKSNCDKIKKKTHTQIVKKLKKSNCDQTQQIKF